MRAVLDMRMIGRGSSSLETVCAMFDFPGALSSAACQNYTSDLNVTSNDAVLAEQLASAGELRIKHAVENLFIPPPIDSENDTSDEPSGSDGGEPSEEAEQSDQSVSSDSESSSSDSGDDPVSDMADSYASLGSHDDQDGSVDRVCDGIPPNVWTNDPLDITVTFDGTWSKWGYTALCGVCVVMYWDTGRILDAVVLSKHCGRCIAKLRALRLIDDQEARSLEEFQEWFRFHGGTPAH